METTVNQMYYKYDIRYQIHYSPVDGTELLTGDIVYPDGEHFKFTLKTGDYSDISMAEGIIHDKLSEQHIEHAVSNTIDVYYKYHKDQDTGDIYCSGLHVDGFTRYKHTIKIDDYLPRKPHEDKVYNELLRAHNERTGDE